MNIKPPENENVRLSCVIKLDYHNLRWFLTLCYRAECTVEYAWSKDFRLWRN